MTVALVAALLSFSLPARAQQAPDGNAHPKNRVVEEGDVRNPFVPEGGVAAAPSSDVAKKLAFARALDLAPLRDLAVFNNGRVKILDTLAREEVATITGRKNYQDFLPDAATGKARKVSYDPLFTLLDLAIDPGYYHDKPLLHVEYLPLREALIEAAYPDKAAREWWKKAGRLTPDVVAANMQAVSRKGPSNAATQGGIGKVLNAFTLYREGYKNLEMIAPARGDEPWAHLSLAAAGSPGEAAAAELGSAWRAGDAARVNAAAAELAAALPAVNPAMYPTTRRAVERVYNAAHPFEIGLWMYFLSLITLLLAFGTGRVWLRNLGVGFLFAAVATHAFGFGARCFIAERFAIQNQFESMTGLSLFAALVGLGIMILRRQWVFAAAASGVGFLVLILATQTGIPGKTIAREAAILNTSVLLKYHVTTVLVSYGLISLGFITSLFYLGTYYAAKLRAGPGRAVAVAGVPGGMVMAETPPTFPTADPAFLGVSASALGLPEGAPKGLRRLLSDLDTAQMIVLQLAFWALGVGILLGAWWADHSWGRWWAFDPKEIWALVTWIVYLIVIHLRFTTGTNRGLVTAWLSVVGFGVMLWTYFGVNLLLPGLHAYA